MLHNKGVILHFHSPYFEKIHFINVCKMLTPKQLQILNMILYFQIRCKLNILQNLFYFVMISHLSELIFVICISNINYCSALLEKSCEIYLCI
jgi:hypothetical protein